MPALHIRNLDDAVIRRLKERARSHNRSLEGELREILNRAAAGGDVEDAKRRTLDLRTVSIPHEGTYGRDEIYGDGDDGR